MGDCVEYHLRYMKFSLSVLLALVGAWAAQAELTIVSGNVYDVGKYSFCRDYWDTDLWKWNGRDYDYKGPQDSAMCWAASAANIIQHWQDTYSDYADPGESVPKGTLPTYHYFPAGTGELMVYDQIFKDWSMGSGVPYNAISLWMQGPTNNGTAGRYVGTGSTLKNWPGESGGYYQKLFGSGTGYMPVYPHLTNAPFYSLQIAKFGNENTSPQLADIRTTLADAFKVQGQAVSLLVQPATPGGSGHAISCWGYETNENGVITSLILSDSDDRMFGTFIVNLIEAVDGTATIQTDRYNSWYHGGDYAIKDVIYITTPKKTSVDIGDKPAGTTVAYERAPQTKIEDLSEPILSSGCLTESVDTTTPVTIGGGTDDHGADVAVVFTTTEKAGISIHYDSDNGALLTVADGGMALLYGGLSLEGGKGNYAQGAEVLGHLYVHGGDMEVSLCNAYEQAGAALHGGVMESFFDVPTDGVYATSYIEVRHAGSVSIHDNASNVSSETFVGGGAISAEDTFSIRDNKSVVINDNGMEGYFVYGGGAFARMEATLSGNTELEMSGNKVVSSSCIAEGGALAAMFTNVCGNGDVSFTKNEARGDNDGVYAAGYPDPATSVYTKGANGRGGALAVTFPSAISDAKGNYMPAELHVDGNGSVTFSQNLAEASYSATKAYSAYASGGALYVGNLLQQSGDPVGAVASISNNTGGITFNGNKALADSYRSEEPVGEANGVARGGAAFVAEKASLSIDSNKVGVTFSNNSAVGSEVSQGGGIYNAGTLKITNNDAVTFSNNTAKEGSHIFNDAEGVAEIAWNDKVLFSGASAEDSTVVNKGEMYLAAKQGQEIQFHNTMLDTTQGTLTVGRDTADTAHATTLTFTKGNTAAAPQARTDVSPRGGVAVELRGLSLSVDNIAGGQGLDVYLNGVAVSTNTDLVVKDMTIGTDMRLEEGSAEHLLTLNKVKIDLGDASESLTSTVNDKGGKDYVFDLRGMLSGAITLNDVVFDASDFFGTEMDFLNRDRVCMMFGDVTYFPEAMDKTTISMVGSGGTPVYCEVVDGGNVYFGEWFQVPEPTTSTLSLLALCALSVRRRRK